ncbi:MAG TPA: DUF3649 domain-containing protein [Cellvibrio sp.]|nr:DUF3649 domain-containing protein [Cellvibrio sp.]
MAKTKISNRELSLYRWQVAVRALLAVLGGYALATLAGIFLTYALPLSRSDAVITANLLSFTLYSIAIIWVFSTQTLRRAGLGLLLAGLALAAAILLFKLFGDAP